MTEPVSVDARIPLESPELQALLREIAALANVLAGRAYVGAGSPQSKIAAPVGALYLRTDGATATTFYIKAADGGLTTGWVAK